MKKNKKENIIDEFGQLPMELEFWLEDNEIIKIEVDYCYLEQVLMRLVDLERLAKTHLAKADIPKAVEYLLSVFPDKMKKRYINNRE